MQLSRDRVTEIGEVPREEIQRQETQGQRERAARLADEREADDDQVAGASDEVQDGVELHGGGA